MDETKQAAQTGALCEQLKTVDASILFLLLIIASVLLSFWSVVIQRRGLCLTIGGDVQGAERLGDVFPMRWKASSIIVGALGFFLCLALGAMESAEGGEDCAAKKSARTNFLAALLVFLAAVLRLDDLRFVERCRPAPEEEDALAD